MHAYAYLLTVDVDITPRIPWLEKTALVLCDLEDDNLKGPFLVMKHGIPHLIRSGGGSIINVGSVSALAGFTVAQDSYTSAKGALVSLNEVDRRPAASVPIPLGDACDDKSCVTTPDRHPVLRPTRDSTSGTPRLGPATPR